MSVVSSTWGFVKRHKGKFFLLGAGVGGFIYLNRLLGSVERNWEKSASKDFVAEVRKKETHFENSVQTANATCTNLAPNILDILDETLDAVPIIEILKKDKNNLKEWKNLTVVIFTRAVAEVYSISLFVCYLRVQLLVIAGYIYIDSVSDSTAPSQINQSIQLKYLSLLNAFYIDGIHEIIKPVQDAVRVAIDDLSIKDKLTCKDLENIFEKVSNHILIDFHVNDLYHYRSA